MKSKFNLTVPVVFLMLIALACNFSTANLSDIKFGKNKEADPASKTFASDDEIFAVSSLNNNSGKKQVKFRLLFDDVEGAESGEVAYKIKKEFEVEGSREFWINFNVPTGIVPGKYKAEYVLLDEDGEKEFDRKTATFTVKGDKSADDSDDDRSSEDEDSEDQ